MRYLLLLLLAAGSATAGEVFIQRHPLGSGVPGLDGSESAVQLSNNIFHAQQFMPGFPTAATIYPRVLDRKCKISGENIECAGYAWSPDMGRAEYLMFKPVIDDQPTPVPNLTNLPPSVSACEPTIYVEAEILTAYRSVPAEIPASAPTKRRVLPPRRLNSGGCK